MKRSRSHKKDQLTCVQDTVHRFSKYFQNKSCCGEFFKKNLRNICLFPVQIQMNTHLTVLVAEKIKYTLLLTNIFQHFIVQDPGTLIRCVIAHKIRIVSNQNQVKVKVQVWAQGG